MNLENSKAEILEKIRRFEDRLAALSKRYEWTLSSEESRSKRRLQSALKKLAKQLTHICGQINSSHNDKDTGGGDYDVDDDLTMTTMSSSDTLSTMCSGFESQPDSYSRSYVPMMPLIPPTPTKAEDPSTNVSQSPDPSKDFMRSGHTHTPTPTHNNNSNNSNTSNYNHNETSDNKKENGVVKTVAYSFSIPKGLLHGISVMFLFGVCTKWYMSLKQRRK